MRRNYRNRNQRRTRRTRFPDVQNTPTSVIRRIVSGTVSGSTATTYTWTDLTSFVTSKASKITSVDVEALSVASNGLINVTLHDYSGAAKTQTRTLRVGSIPVRFKVRMPKSTDFGFPSDDAIALGLSGACVFDLIVNIATRE